MIEVAAAYVGAMAAGPSVGSLRSCPAAPAQRRCERHEAGGGGVAPPLARVHQAATWAGTVGRFLWSAAATALDVVVLFYCGVVSW